MDAQPVRVIVRLPYNRPEHLQAELVSGTPSVSSHSSQGPTQQTHVHSSLGLMELG